MLFTGDTSDYNCCNREHIAKVLSRSDSICEGKTTGNICGVDPSSDSIFFLYVMVTLRPSLPVLNQICVLTSWNPAAHQGNVFPTFLVVGLSRIFDLEVVKVTAIYFKVRMKCELRKLQVIVFPCVCCPCLVLNLKISLIQKKKYKIHKKQIQKTALLSLDS